MKTSSGSSPSGLRLAGFEQAMTKLDSQAPALQQIQDRLGQRATRFEGASRATNAFETTAIILESSIKEMNGDKKYHLDKIAELMAAELKRLADGSAALAVEEARAKGGRGERPKRP